MKQAAIIDAFRETNRIDALIANKCISYVRESNFISNSNEKYTHWQERENERTKKKKDTNETVWWWAAARSDITRDQSI